MRHVQSEWQNHLIVRRTRYCNAEGGAAKSASRVLQHEKARNQRATESVLAEERARVEEAIRAAQREEHKAVARVRKDMWFRCARK